MQRFVLLLPLIVAGIEYGSFECGQPAFPIIRNPYPTRIVGGWEAKPHSIPWQTYVMSFKTATTYGACGGSLIQLKPGNGTSLVITAAHCVNSNGTYTEPEKIEVVVGAHEVTSRHEASQRRIQILNYIHHDYNTSTKENDIIIIKLKEVVPYTPYTRPVCLPEQDEDLPYEASCFVSGWGTIEEGGQTSPLLKMVDVKLYRKSECYLHESKQEKMLCAGYVQGGKDSCQGDSGGPLVCEVSGRWTQIGVVSFGSGCAKPGLPGIYVKMSYYVTWIKSKGAELMAKPNENAVPTENVVPSLPVVQATVTEPHLMTDAYYLKPQPSHFGTLYEQSASGVLLPGGVSLVPHNVPFTSQEVSSFFQPNGAIKPGYSHSFSGFGTHNRPQSKPTFVSTYTIPALGSSLGGLKPANHQQSGATTFTSTYTQAMSPYHPSSDVMTVGPRPTLVRPGRPVAQKL